MCSWRWSPLELGSLEHGILIMDQAGWHKSRGLRVPDNLTILYLPPYSPELNPVERLWAYLRDHFPSNRAYDDYRHPPATPAPKPGKAPPPEAPPSVEGTPVPHARDKGVIRIRSPHRPPRYRHETNSWTARYSLLIIEAASGPRCPCLPERNRRRGPQDYSRLPWCCGLRLKPARALRG